MALTTQELLAEMWHAAVEILRGQIDSATTRTRKPSGFSMLFLKRLSDRFDEEVEAAVAAGVPREAALADMDEHQVRRAPGSPLEPDLQRTDEPGRSALNVAGKRH